MSSFVLKIIAIITMFADHVGYVIFNDISFFNVIGRISFSLFAFQISEGYKHTSNLKKYFLRLLIFALISQIPFMLFRKNILLSTDFKLNIGFTLLLGLTAIFIFDKLKNRFLGLLAVILISILGFYIDVDYKALGVLLIFSFYFFDKNNIFLIALYSLITSCMYFDLPNNYIYIVAAMLPLLFVFLYNKKQGKSLKYIFYAFYPAHLLVLTYIKIFFLIS